MTRVAVYHIAFFIVIRVFFSTFTVSYWALVSKTFFSFHKNTSLSESVVNLVLMSLVLYSLSICEVFSIMVADYGQLAADIIVRNLEAFYKELPTR